MEQIAWGAKVSVTFIDRVKWIVDTLEIGFGTVDGTNKLMSCIAFESGRTFKANVRNMAGSGATGLIQFMPSTARKLGTTTTALAAMTAEDQLNFVYKYFEPYKGKLKTINDIYMAILWPRAVGKPDDHVLWTKAKAPTTFRQNAGLDYNKDGTITKGEASRKVAKLLYEGLEPGNVRTLEEPKKRTVEAAARTKEIVPVTVEKPKRDKLELVLDGLGNTVTGVAVIAGSLLLNPDFANKLGDFTLALARGEGSWGALASVVGVGLMVYGRLRQIKKG